MYNGIAMTVVMQISIHRKMRKKLKECLVQRAGPIVSGKIRLRKGYWVSVRHR